MEALQKLAIGMGVGVLKLAMPLITEGLRVLMIESVQKWDAYTKTTPYNWDNTVVDALQAILQIPDAEPKPEPGEPPTGVPGPCPPGA